MAKTRLFSRFRELTALVYSARARGAREGQPLLEQVQTLKLKRREFLRASALGVSAAAALPASVLVASTQGCTSPPAVNVPLKPDEISVAVIGAGLAGLHCAYRLKQAGVIATIFEASPRVGGRTFTDRKNFGDQLAELGGELIDSNHATLHVLAEEFGIKLDDRQAGLGDDVIDEVWWVGGAAVAEATIVEQFSKVAPLMATLASAADEDEEKYAELDATSLETWLTKNVPQTEYPELFSVLENAYRGEYGLELKQQSCLNLLYLIGSDDPEPFRIFGESDERYHAHEGSQIFADRLAAELSGQIETGMQLVAITDTDAGAYRASFVRVRAGEAAADKEALSALESQFDYVIFALPFTALRRVDLKKLKLPALKLQIIEELAYGTNTKLMGAFNSRVWLTEHDAAGSVTSDEAFQQAWDTSRGQPGEQGVLTNFLGGSQGQKSGDGDAESWYREVFLKGIENIFPGTSAAYKSGSAVRMHWPSQPFTLGSYTCYKPGQWAFWGEEKKRVQNLLFCGEHTSDDFQGFMEGAAESGARAAAELLGDLGLTPSRVHQALMRLWLDLPQRSSSGRPLLHERRRALAERWRALKAQSLPKV